MQKKVIALAVAGLMSGAAFAQSNVTISGRVDMGYHHSTVSKTGAAADTTSGIDSGTHDGSRLAFSGEENLGNGLKAIFMLEYSLAADTNSAVGASSVATGSSSRQSWLGLTGNFGTVTAGRIYTPSYDMGGFDSMDQTNFSPRVILAGVDNLGDRWSNAVKYSSPTISGFTVGAIYGFSPLAGADTTAYNGSAATNEDQERAYGVGVTYANGPLSVGLYHDRANDMENGQGNKAGITRLGASYDFGVVALYGTYEKGSLKERTTTTNWTASTGTDKAKLWSLGATMPLGNGLVRTMYGKLSINDAANTDSDGSKGWAIGYDYNLSKRTMLYSGYARAKADDNATAGLNIGTFANNSGNGGKYSSYGFGMIHKF